MRHSHLLAAAFAAFALSLFSEPGASQPAPQNFTFGLMGDLGYGKEYRYAHDEPDAYAAGERYLPDGMRDPKLYEPVPRGLEARIKERMDELRQRDKDAKKPKADE